MRDKAVLTFTLQLTLILGVAFIAHSFIQYLLGIYPFENHIIITYIFNYILTALFFGVLLFFKNKQSSQLGFIFLGSSILKFLLFFIILSPLVRTEHGIKSPEFISFFVPYAVSSTFEVLCMVRLLNK